MGGCVASGFVAIVIPAFNEAQTIDAVTRDAVAAATALPVPGLVIVVDDGSADDTAQRAEAAGAQVVRHPVNRGKAAALMTGFAEAARLGARGVITLDADGQHRPADVPRLLDAAALHPDRIIIGSRMFDRAAFPAARYRANRIASFWISWAAGHDIEDSQSGFRFYPAALLDDLHIAHDRGRSFVFESEVLIVAARRGITTIAVPVPALYDGVVCRPSHFRPVADITRIVLMVAGKLLARGMDVPGLVRSVRQARGRVRRWNATT